MLYEGAMKTIARALVVLALFPGCKGKEKSEPKPAAADPAKPDPAAGDPAKPAAADWKRVDLYTEGNKTGVSSLSGTIEVPAAAVLDFGTSKGLDDLPVDSVFVTAGALKMALDVGPGSADMPKDLATYLKKANVADADVLEKSEQGGGYAISYKTEGNVAVMAVYPNLSCGVTLEAKDAALAKDGFRVCASYQAPAE